MARAKKQASRIVWCKKHRKAIPQPYEKSGSMTPEYAKMKCFEEHPDDVTWRTIGLKPKKAHGSLPAEG